MVTVGKVEGICEDSLVISPHRDIIILYKHTVDREEREERNITSIRVSLFLPLFHTHSYTAVTCYTVSGSSEGVDF